MKLTPTPKGLQAAGRDLWISIATQWADDDMLPDARERRLLADACHEADTLSAIEVELDAARQRGEMVVSGSQGQPVSHPMIAEARASRGAIRQALLKLGFTDPAMSQSSPRAPMTVAEAGRRGGMMKHHRSHSGIG